MKWQITNSAISFYNVHDHFNSHSIGRLVLYTCIFVEEWIQWFTVYRYRYGYWDRQDPIILGIGYWVAFFGIVLTLLLIFRYFHGAHIQQCQVAGMWIVAGILTVDC